MAESTAQSRRRRHRKPPKDLACMRERINYLYRLSDSEGTVLYIGRSVRPLERLRAHHASGAEWAARVVTVEAWGPFDWEQVVRLEREAITEERPIGNREFVINKRFRLDVS